MELMLCILLLSGVNKRVVLKDLKFVFLKLKYFKWVFFLMFILILKLNKIGWWLEESLILYNDGLVLGFDINVGVLVRMRFRMLFFLNFLVGCFISWNK